MAEREDFTEGWGRNDAVISSSSNDTSQGCVVKMKQWKWPSAAVLRLRFPIPWRGAALLHDRSPVARTFRSAAPGEWNSSLSLRTAAPVRFNFQIRFRYAALGHLIQLTNNELQRPAVGAVCDRPVPPLRWCGQFQPTTAHRRAGFQTWSQSIGSSDRSAPTAAV